MLDLIKWWRLQFRTRLRKFVFEVFPYVYPSV
jgi:hypothetical protein